MLTSDSNKVVFTSSRLINVPLRMILNCICQVFGIALYSNFVTAKNGAMHLQFAAFVFAFVYSMLLSQEGTCKWILKLANPEYTLQKNQC